MRLAVFEATSEGVKEECMNSDFDLATRAAQLEAILESAVDAIITIDERGMIESVNPATERMFGYASAELRGKNVSMLMRGAVSCCTRRVHQQLSAIG